MPRGRIAIFCSDLVHYGGAERLLFEEAAYFQAQGYEVAVPTLRFDPQVAFDDVYRCPVHVLTKRDVPMLRGEVHAFASETMAVWAWLRCWSPHLVIAMSPNDCALLLLPSMATGIPYVTHVNGTFFWFPPGMDQTKYAHLHRRAFRRVLQASPWHRQFLPEGPPRLAFKRAARIEATAILHWLAVRRARRRISLSHRMAWEVELIYGKPANDIKGAFPRAILNHRPASDPLAPFRRDGGPVVLNVNRLDPRKRIDLVLQAFAIVSRRFPRVTLVIGGKGPIEQDLRELACQLGIADRVHFAGFVPERDLWDWLASCEVFIHPNWAEFAIAPYEALALGTKVVWTTEMEMDEAVHRTGLVYPAAPLPDDTAAALASALEAPRGTPAARQSLADYTWDCYFSRLHDIIGPDLARSSSRRTRT